MNDLTVFIIKSGKNPNFEDCLKAIKNQTFSFKIQMVIDIAPMSKAFQYMIDNCLTKYCVQVDQDMILKPNAIEILYNKMQDVYKEVAILGCMLYDPHLDKNIYGVKIYNTEIIKRYPYKNSLSCEVDQIKEFEKDGYRFHFSPEVIGQHSPKWTKELIFERYFNLMEKFKQYKYNWLQHVPQQLYQKVKKQPTDENIYALLGAYTSISQKENLQDKEKDFRSLKRKELGRFESYFHFPTTANLYMTDICNFKCKFCLRQYKEIEKHPEVNVELCRKMLSKYPTIKSVCIAGYGEPFLAKNFIPVLKFLKNRGIYVGVITNGSVVESKFQLLKLNRPDYISVSINASNADLHEQITGTKTFDKVKENIKKLLTLNIPIYLSVVVAKEWLKDIPEVLKLAKELGVKGVDIHNLLPHVYGDNTKWFEANVIKIEDTDIFAYLKALPNADIIRTYPIPIYDNPCQSCDSAWKSLGMNGNGSISICSAIFPPSQNFGNINNDSVWFSDGCIQFRDLFLDNQFEVCKRCFRNHLKDN